MIDKTGMGIGGYWKYLKYVVRHKWFVFLAARKLHVPLWIALLHDWDKFLPDEFGPYARFFNGKWQPARDIPHLPALIGVGINPRTKENVKRDFFIAWGKHQKRNKHHWQYWLEMDIAEGYMSVRKSQLVVMDTGGAFYPDDCEFDVGTAALFASSMPDTYRREMLADWIGAGRAVGKPDTAAWYKKNRDRMILHPETRAWIEAQLGVMRSLEGDQ